MKRSEIVEWLGRRGWKSRLVWPHLFYKEEQPTRRYKITSHGLRYEARLENGEWMRLRSGYFKNLRLTTEDKISGLTSRGM